MVFLRRAAYLLAATCLATQVGAQARPKMDDELPKPFAKWSTAAQGLRDSIVAVAKRQVGIKYRIGESSPTKGFDCSGLVQYVMDRFHIELPRTSRQQATVGKALARDVRILRPGDLLTFGHGNRVQHIGIYIGNGRYVHASSRGRVKEGTLLTNQIMTWWRGARRIVASTDSIATDTLSN